MQISAQLRNEFVSWSVERECSIQCSGDQSGPAFCEQLKPILVQSYMVSFFNANYDRLVIDLNLIHSLMDVLKGIIERTTCYDGNSFPSSVF